LYHHQGPLEVQNGHIPRYAQLFFYDPAYAVSVRSAHNPQLDHSILAELMEMLRETNPFISIYQTANERLRTAAAAGEDARVILNPQMRLLLEAGADQRRHNLPTSNEVALIIADEYGEPCSREIVLTYRNGTGLSYIDPNHGAYMPLHYVLLFPGGDMGWHWALELCNVNGVRTRIRMTQRAFYRHRLHVRKHDFNTLCRGGRLFQQYVVDAWSICDGNKLNWLRKH
jgi:hypothetical protein